MVIAAGTPEEVAAERASHTGEFIRELVASKRSQNGRLMKPRAKSKSTTKSVTKGAKVNGAVANGSGAKRKAKSVGRA